MNQFLLLMIRQFLTHDPISPDNDSPNLTMNQFLLQLILLNRPTSNQPTSVDEVSLDDGWLNASMQRMLITLGLAIQGKFSNEFTYWTNFIAHIAGHALGIWICGCSLFYKREL